MCVCDLLIFLSLSFGTGVCASSTASRSIQREKCYIFKSSNSSTLRPSLAQPRLRLFNSVLEPESVRTRQHPDLYYDKNIIYLDQVTPQHRDLLSPDHAFVCYTLRLSNSVLEPEFARTRQHPDPGALRVLLLRAKTRNRPSPPA